MPTFYGLRKSSRGKWTEEELLKAVEAVRVMNVPIRYAARENNIPEITLRFRMQKNNFKNGVMGGKNDLRRRCCKKTL